MQEEAAKAYPKVRVNRRSCSIRVHTYKQTFSVQPHQSFMEIAAEANHYVEVAEDIHRSFLGLSKKLGG